MREQVGRNLLILEHIKLAIKKGVDKLRHEFSEDFTRL